MGLRKKGLISFVLISIPVLTFTASLISVIAEKQILKSEAERVSLITDIVRNGLVTIMIEGRGKDLRRFLDTLIAEDIEGIYILGKEGNVISSTASPSLDKRFLDQVMSRSWRGIVEMTPMKINEKDIYSSILPIYNERTCQKCHGSREDIRAILHVEVSRERTISKLKTLRYWVAMLTFLSFLVLLFLFYKFNLSSILRPISQIADIVRKGPIQVSQVDMDELQILTLHINNLSRDVERITKEMKSVQSSNKELLERIDAVKRTIKDDVTRPLLKIIASIEALLEETAQSDPKREIMKTFINELKRLVKTLETLIRY